MRRLLSFERELEFSRIAKMAYEVGAFSTDLSGTTILGIELMCGIGFRSTAFFTIDLVDWCFCLCIRELYALF